MSKIRPFYLLMRPTNFANTKQQHWQCTYERNIERRSLNYRCRGKTISVTYSECISEALGIPHAPYYIVIAGLSRSTIFFCTLSHKRHEFRKDVLEHKMCVLIPSTTYAWNNSHSRKNWAKDGYKRTEALIYRTVCSCQIIMKIGFSRKVLEKFSYIKFRENPSSGSRIFPCGRTDRQVWRS